MQSARLPLDVCEHIIRSCLTEPWNLADDLRRLRVCTLVCKSWYSYSLRCLWMHVSISKHSDAQRLVRIFGQYPSLAHLVVELDVSSCSLFDSRKAPQLSTFLGWGELVLRKPHFTSLRTLRLCHLDFRVYPPSYYKCFTSFHSVAHLEISWVTFRTARDLLRLIWSFRALEYLQLSSGLQIQDQRTTRCKHALEEFCAARYPFLCPKLRFLDILVRLGTPS